MSHADPNCPFCHGEGYIWDDPTELMPISGHTCSCMLRNIEVEERGVRLAAARLPEKYRDASVDAFHLRGGTVSVENKDRSTTEAVALADIDQRNAERVLELASQPLGGKNVVFTGPIGAGKTLLASALLIAQIRDHGKSGLYITFLEYVRHLLPDGDAPDAQRALRDMARNVDVLLIDDLGVEKTSAFAMRELWAVVHARTSTRDRGIIITSNYTLADAIMFRDREPKGLTPDQIEAMELGKRIYSRLVESGVLPIAWPAGTKDFRRELSPATGGERRSPTYAEQRERQRAGRAADVLGSTFDPAELAAAVAQVIEAPTGATVQGIDATPPDGEDLFGAGNARVVPSTPTSTVVTRPPATRTTPVARGAGRQAPPEGSTPLAPAPDEDF